MLGSGVRVRLDFDQAPRTVPFRDGVGTHYPITRHLIPITSSLFPFAHQSGQTVSHPQLERACCRQPLISFPFSKYASARL